MSRKLPPLNALKSFEAAAKYSSFTTAANDLGVTQGAISKQIKVLEEFLGESLFMRHPHHIELTQIGKKFFSTIQQSFFDIEQAVLDIIENAPENKILIVNSMPTIGAYWLIPRLEHFTKLNKNLKVNVTISDEEKLDFSSINADIAIKGSNTKTHEDVKKTKLFDETLVLICGKERFANNPIREIQDIKKHPILEHSSREDLWEGFLHQNKIHNFEPSKTIALEHFFMLIEAVEKNMGLALVPSFLVSEHVKDNNLINPLGLTYDSNFRYYLIYPKLSEHQNKVRNFIKWIQSATSQ